MTTSSFLSCFAFEKKKIEQALGSILPKTSPSSLLPLFEAMRYAVLKGGKRFRPLLCIATAKALDADENKTIHPAVALELVHAYSLVHDDLPCMDNDDFRHGQPTVHKMYNEWQALLTGDALLTLAFSTLADASHLNEKEKISLISRLANKSGCKGMVGGQYLDLAQKGKSTSLTQLQEIHQRKTGDLLETAILFGAVLGNADDKTMQLLQKWGQRLGLAFQLADDIVDVVASEEKHGTTTSSDIANQTATSISLLGLKKTEEWVEQLLIEAKTLLNDFQGDRSYLDPFLDQIHTKIKFFNNSLL